MGGFGDPRACGFRVVINGKVRCFTSSEDAQRARSAEMDRQIQDLTVQPVAVAGELAKHRGIRAYREAAMTANDKPLDEAKS